LVCGAWFLWFFIEELSIDVIWEKLVNIQEGR